MCVYDFVYKIVFVYNFMLSNDFAKFIFVLEAFHVFVLYYFLSYSYVGLYETGVARI